MSRWDLYFVKHTDLEDAYVKTNMYLQKSGCKEVGINVLGGAWEYPLLIELLRNNVHFGAININNTSTPAQKYYSESYPCRIVTIYEEVNETEPENYLFRDHMYRKDFREDPIRIYVLDK